MAETWVLPLEPRVVKHKDQPQITRDVCSALERKPGFGWWLAFLCALTALGWGVWALRQGSFQ